MIVFVIPRPFYSILHSPSMYHASSTPCECFPRGECVCPRGEWATLHPKPRSISIVACGRGLTRCDLAPTLSLDRCARTSATLLPAAALSWAGPKGATQHRRVLRSDTRVFTYKCVLLLRNKADSLISVSLPPPVIQSIKKALLPLIPPQAIGIRNDLQNNPNKWRNK